MFHFMHRPMIRSATRDQFSTHSCQACQILQFAWFLSVSSVFVAHASIIKHCNSSMDANSFRVHNFRVHGSGYRINCSVSESLKGLAFFLQPLASREEGTDGKASVTLLATVLGTIFSKFLAVTVLFLKIIYQLGP